MTDQETITMISNVGTQLAAVAVLWQRVSRVEEKLKALGEFLSCPMKRGKNIRLPFTLSVLIGLAVLNLFFAVGCSTTGAGGGSQTAKLVPIVKVAAYVGTSEALRSHPEWRLAFVLAAEELQRLETDPQIGFDDLLIIVHRLPVKELKSDRAILAITSATILLSEFGGTTTSIDAVEIQPIAKALREGIALGLQSSPSALFINMNPVTNVVSVTNATAF